MAAQDTVKRPAQAITHSHSLDARTPAFIAISQGGAYGPRAIRSRVLCVPPGSAVSVIMPLFWQTDMHYEQLLLSTMATLGSVLPQYGEFRFDRTLEAARRDIGDVTYLACRAHAVRLRKWLNQWTCRIGYPKAEKPTCSSTPRAGG